MVDTMTSRPSTAAPILAVLAIVVPLLLRVREAYDRVQHLRMVIHYLECEAGKRA